jgi:outer membrane receptor protein involved in Fe transport
MFQRIILFLIVMGLAHTVLPQSGKGDRVKRKYRQVDRISEKQPLATVHGRVLNTQRQRLAGAAVIIPGTIVGVHANEQGEYFLKGLPVGKTSIQVSCMGYATKTIDWYLLEGNNDVYFTLDRPMVALDPVMVTAQLRDQQLVDIPSAVSVLGLKQPEVFDLYEISKVQECIPGLLITPFPAGFPEFQIRGVAAGAFDPGQQPRIPVFIDHLSTGKTGLSHLELFDTERIEVMKGPQCTLYGPDAEAGVIRFLAVKPGQEREGFLTVGYGEYGMKETQGAITIPLLKEKLSVRLAGNYLYREGYLSNKDGGTLNGKNSLGGRLSLRYYPYPGARIDLMLLYLKKREPGTAFINSQISHTGEVPDIFSSNVSLDPGEKLINNQKMTGASLDFRHYKNENNYYSLIATFLNSNGDQYEDADGTSLPVASLDERSGSGILSLEGRIDFSVNSRMNGTAGLNYRWERSELSRLWEVNEQYLVHLILGMPENLYTTGGIPNPLTVYPDGFLAGMPLPGIHQEMSLKNSDFQYAGIFTDFTWNLFPRIRFTGGIRIGQENLSARGESLLAGKDSSLLGLLTGYHPNLFSTPASERTLKNRNLSINYRARLNYALSSETSLFAGYSKGSRPPMINFAPDGTAGIFRAEVLHNFEGGIKLVAGNRFRFDMTGFYQLFRNFDNTDPDDGQVSDAGKAASRGIEGSFRLALLKNLEIFGNSSWIHARFDSTDTGGRPQLHAGKEFRLTPSACFAAGFRGSVPVNRFWRFFVVPLYAWKSQIWFDDANTPAMKQPSYGTLDMTAGFVHTKPDITISLSGTNLLDERTIVNGKHPAAIFGISVLVPGPPSMVNGRITWKF